MKRILVTALIFLLCSCGLRFAPGYSVNDPNYFGERPRIYTSEGGYKLAWTYGEFGFYFEPRCIVEVDELLCSLQGSSSSGALTGKVGEIHLQRSVQIEAIRSNKAYWLEPNGKRIKLEVVGDD